MQILIIIFLLLLNPLLATYVIISDEQALHEEQRIELFDLMLRGEPPHSFYHAIPLDLELKFREIAPSLHLQWIPPTLWQLAVLHAFFFDKEVHDGILACSGKGWEPLCYDEMLHSHLNSAYNMEKIIECFDSQTKSLPNIYELFSKVNRAVASLYKRGRGSDAGILHLAISEIPTLDEWQERHFPFWSCPWISNSNSIQLFYQALKNESLLSNLLQIERTAHENGEWVLYRGYDSFGYPSALMVKCFMRTPR